MIVNYDPKSFIVQATDPNVIKILRMKFMNVRNKLECLALASFFILVQCLQVKPTAKSFPKRVETERCLTWVGSRSYKSTLD